jgi:hypothetical protein
MLVTILIYAILSNMKKMQIGFGKLKDAMLVIIFGPFGIENYQCFIINYV